MGSVPVWNMPDGEITREILERYPPEAKAMLECELSQELGVPVLFNEQADFPHCHGATIQGDHYLIRWLYHDGGQPVVEELATLLRVQANDVLGVLLNTSQRLILAHVRLPRDTAWYTLSRSMAVSLLLLLRWIDNVDRELLTQR